MRYFQEHRKSSIFGIVCSTVLMVATCLAADAQITDSFSINFAKIEAVDGVATFGIDVNLFANDVLEVDLPSSMPLTDVTLKRGTVSRSGDGAVIFISENINLAKPDKPSADSYLSIQRWSTEEESAALCDTVGNLVRVTTRDGAAALRLLEIRFEAIGDEQLSGTPANLFNQPTPGEPLVLKLPEIKPGDNYSTFVEVRHAKSSIRIPITVKHHI